MHRQHRMPCSSRQRAQRARLLAHRVGPDHDLDAVVAQPGGQLERRRRTPRGRPTPSTAPPSRRARRPVVPDRPHRAPRVGTAQPHPVQAPQDDALAQRPRADLEVVQAEQVHRRRRPRWRRRAAGASATPTRPGRSARSAAVMPASSGSRAASVGALEAARRRTCPRLLGAAPQIRASERIVFEVPTAWSGVPALASGRSSAAIGRAHLLARPRARRPAAGGSPGSRSRVTRPAPSGSDTATSGSSSMPWRELQRAAADVGDEQGAGRPAEPAADREEGQPGLVLTAQHLERRPRCARRRRRARRRRWGPRGWRS